MGSHPAPCPWAQLLGHGLLRRPSGGSRPGRLRRGDLLLGTTHSWLLGRQVVPPETQASTSPCSNALPRPSVPVWGLPGSPQPEDGRLCARRQSRLGPSCSPDLLWAATLEEGALARCVPAPPHPRVTPGPSHPDPCLRPGQPEAQLLERAVMEAWGPCLCAPSPPKAPWDPPSSSRNSQHPTKLARSAPASVPKPYTPNPPGVQLLPPGAWRDGKGEASKTQTPPCPAGEGRSREYPLQPPGHAGLAPPSWGHGRAERAASSGTLACPCAGGGTRPLGPGITGLSPAHPRPLTHSLSLSKEI